MSKTPTPVPFVDLHALHQSLQDEIEQAVRDVLDRGDFILGRAVKTFEGDFACACGVSCGIGVSCGTDAIALGLRACGIGTGDEVIVPANTFIATLIGVLHAGATPVLVDCDPDTALMDLEAAERAITPRTQALLPVHLYGQMVSPYGLQAIATRHDLLIFEDAAQAHLAHRDGYTAGSVGMAAAFSFYPSKNLGAGGNGGITVTPNAHIAERLQALRNYGAPQKYVHAYRGTNSRLDTLQAAILNVKLPRLPEWNRQRNEAARRYDRQLEPLRESGIVPMRNDSDRGHVYHLYVVRVTDESPLTRDELAAELEQQGIQTGIHYPIPCHLQPAYRDLGYEEGRFPHAETLSRQILSLPMFPGLSEAQIDLVVRAIETAVRHPVSAARS
ncbi:erythromycin biosynthesis sensory transduction protein eryC1 [Leptolyngbya valderiana BDU 20041]|nr:erythromycin biosynthesis sensory transduction protein eryC1 [Leptolyngbya valderiana BDU 20041]PPT10353.1 Aminotransferase [Geitlerinema sp. FC II]